MTISPAIPTRSPLVTMTQSELARAAAGGLGDRLGDGSAGAAAPVLDAVQHALKRAGIEFIDGDRPGVRLRK